MGLRGFVALLDLLLLCTMLVRGDDVGIELFGDGSQNGGGRPTTVRPLIGILTQPGDRTGSGLIANHSGISTIMASYVKFVEAGGARAVPLLFNEPEDELRRKFSAINGIIFPGGTADFEGLYLETGRKFLKWAMEANDRGDYFPIYGVCLGFQFLSVLVAERYMLDGCPAHAIHSPLYFVDKAAKTKSVFKWIPNDILDELETNVPLAYQNHDWGVRPQTFYSIPSLVDFFEVLALTPDENGELYISAMQGRRYPVTAIMFHPEKNAFEWYKDNFSHSLNAVRLTQSIANFVVSEAKKSSHAPASNSEEDGMLVSKYLMKLIKTEYYYLW